MEKALTTQPATGPWCGTREATPRLPDHRTLLEAPVLTVTEQAASMIRELIDQAELPEGAGLRIAQRDDHTALAMTLTDQPSFHDMVLIERDVAVFLGPAAFYDWLRNLPEDRIRQLVTENTQGRLAGLLGEPRVNVLALNLALDSAAAK